MSNTYRTIGIGMILILELAFFSGACKKDKKDPNPSINYKEYRLINISGGSSVDAGSFRVDELQDGNTKITILISEPFRQDGAGFQASVNKKDSEGNELVLSNLGLVNGGLGSLVVNPVLSSGTNLPVKYNELVGPYGYYVKILNGANVQALGDIN